MMTCGSSIYSKVIAAAFILYFIFSTAVQSEDFEPGLTVDYSVEAFEKKAQVWLPKNYDPKRKFPVIFYYHGTNGTPTVELIRLISQSENWIIVGMSYRHAGQFQYTPENLAAEIKVFRDTYKELSKSLQINPEKVYMSGFSKGGWMTAFFLQKVPELAGGLILGGGVVEAKESSPDPNDQIFIGSGDLDNNVAPSLRASQFFKKSGSKVVLDRWEGRKHEGPDRYSDEAVEKFRQWLNVQAEVADQSKAIDWFDKEMLQIRHLEKAEKNTEAFHRIVRLSSMPYRELLDSEGKGVLKKLQTRFREKPEIQKEYQAWVQFQKALNYEAKDRYIETLAEALNLYQNVASEYPETKFGKKATLSVERINVTLGL